MKACSECQRCWRDGRTLHNRLYAHQGQADRASLKRPGVEPPATPRLFLSAATKRGSCGRKFRNLSSAWAEPFRSRKGGLLHRSSAHFGLLDPTLHGESLLSSPRETCELLAGSRRAC